VWDQLRIVVSTLAVFLLTLVAAPAQTSAPEVTEQPTLASAKIGQRYELLVSLPEGYAKSGQSYPVLYVLDGWHFPVLRRT
jgi:enterochelin esterase-like enzyme